MAARGWKLRKDKTPAEISAAESETSVAESETTETLSEPTAEHGAAVYGAPIIGEELPAAFLETEHTPATDMETGSDLHFEGEDDPLKLIDYSAPFTTDDFLPQSGAPIIAQPPLAPEPPAEEVAPEPPKAEMPTPSAPVFDISAAEPDDTAGDFTSTLRMSREELAAAFAPSAPSGFPVVAPFVLDTPLVSPAAEEAQPRLVVRMGRLSAAFDLTKEVTVIGRPDSEMHYYPDVEIDMDDAISRRHAEIIKRDDSYSLVDTGSTNGTMLNGETLPAHQERRLTHGDRIRVGERTEIIFE